MRQRRREEIEERRRDETEERRQRIVVYN